MLSVEPWLVEPPDAKEPVQVMQVSVLSVEPWLVEPVITPASAKSQPRFSALSRAVVGGTMSRGRFTITGGCFSALSRAVVGGTRENLYRDPGRSEFQCSQSSRGWWNISVHSF